MFLNVDYIGAEAVANILVQTNLKRFIIFRQGAPHTSTPVYDCSFTTTNAAAVKSFKDWASNILQFNPQNFLCYELLAFDDFEAADDQPSKQNNFKPKAASGKKTGKMRVSFALNAGSMSQGNNTPPTHHAPQIDIQGEIQKGIAAAMKDHEIKLLKERVAELENEDDDDDQGGEDIVAKVTNMINAINGVKADPTEHAVLNGDQAIEGNLTDVKNIHNLTPAELQIKTKNIKAAVNILFKHNKDLDIDLLKLANLAQTNKIVFKMILEKLRAF